MDIFTILSSDRRGSIVIDSEGHRRFISASEINTEFLVFEHNSPNGPAQDKVILIPVKESAVA